MKKIIWLLLFCMLLTPVLAACKDKKGNETPTGTTEGGVVKTEPEFLKTLPEADFNNEEFIFMCFAGEELVNYDENNTSDPIAADQFARTRWINDKYNCLIKMDFVGGGNNSWDALVKNHDAGGGNFDAAMMHPTEGKEAHLSGGYCTDLLTVSTLHFDGEWYNQDMVANTQVNGKLLGMSSDFTVAGSGITAFVYNEALYKSLGGELNIYQTIMDGDWTIATVIETMKKLNVTGFDSSTSSHGTYALGVNYFGHRSPMLWGAGVETSELGDGNQWTMVWNTRNNREKINQVLDYLHDLEENVKFYNNYTMDASGNPRGNWHSELPNSELLRLWNNKKLVFMTWDVGSMYQYLRDADFDIGYAPMPKLNTQQANYVSTATIGGTIIPSVNSVEHSEKVGAVLEGLARYSYVYTRPVFFEAIVGGRLSENPEDYAMLNLIYNSKYYRPDFAFAGKLYDICSKSELPDSCADFMDSNEMNYRNLMEKVNNLGK